MSAVLALQSVTKRYQWRGPWVLSGADLTVEPGSLTSVVGSNGSGKSTLLRIAAGVSPPSSGVAYVPRRVGFVPERQAGRGKFTGAQYLAHMGRIRGLSSREASIEGTELLARLGVQPGPEIPWDRLSKGNRQKVVLAQAFLGRLDAVVLDEPFSGLDDDARRALIELVSEVRAQGTSVMLSSHDVLPGVSQTYRIVGGRLQPEVPRSRPITAQLRRVELVGKGGESSPADLTARTEVVSWEVPSGGFGVVLNVRADVCDALIRAALDLGWSVQSVRPIDSIGKD